MPDEPPPDYTTMTGAQFQRAVGADPEKWAEAYMQRAAHLFDGVTADGLLEVEPRKETVAYLAEYFRDAMEAAVKAHKPLPEGPDTA